MPDSCAIVRAPRAYWRLMAIDNVEIVRRGYKAFEQGGVEGILEFLDPAIEWHMSAAFTRATRVYRGHDGVREVFRFFNELIADLGADPHEFIDAGDRVIVPVRLHGRLRETGEPVAYELVQVWLGRDGKAIRLNTYPDRETAVAEAGGSPEAVAGW
jgi:ketosteroid isomerase-like protein